MKKPILLLTLSFLFIAFVHAQVLVKGQFVNLPPEITKIAVDYWSQDRWHELDVINLTPEKSFEKQIAGSYGQARIRLWGQPTRWVDFIFPKNSIADPVLDFGNLDYGYVNANPANLKGKENEAYYGLLNINKNYRILRDSLLRNKLMPAPEKLALKNQVESAKAILNERCKKVSAENKGTFTGDIVARVLLVPETSDFPEDKTVADLNEDDFDRDYFLDLLPTADGRILQHNGLIRALNLYTSKYLETDSSAYINTIMGIRKGNEIVDTWLFKYLLQTLVNYKDDKGLSYLLKWYSNACSMDELNKDQSTALLLTSLKNCTTGKKAFDLLLPDQDGKKTALSEMATKGNLTLIMFWRTDCSHCREFEPELEELYKKYKSSGLEIVGISLDVEELPWKKYLAERPAKWPNLRPVTNDQRVQVVTHFPIPGTPSIIAVDKNFIVKNRMVIRQNIEEYLKEELGVQ